jgi:hypothetical protein
VTDLEAEILTFAPQWYFPGRAQSGSLLDRSANVRNATIAGDAAASGPALFSGSTAPSDNVGSSGDFHLLASSSGIVMNAADSWTLGAAFYTTETGLATILSDETCTRPAYAIEMNNGRVQLRLVNSNGAIGDEIHQAAVTPVFNDGVPHIIVWRKNGGTSRHRVDVDGVNVLDVIATYQGNLNTGGTNHYLGIYANCGRFNPVDKGNLGHWFGISSELANGDIAAIQTASGTANTGTALQPSSLQEVQNLAIQANDLLTKILNSVRKVY